jgi:uncharacterized sulfatase
MNMRFPSLIEAIVLLIGLSVFSFCSGTMPAAAADRPNVLLIVSDDLRCTLGCYGVPAVKSPNIDRLATRGVVFEHAYCQYPVCNPSRASFMTGLRCEQTGVTSNKTFFRDSIPDVITLPQLLRQQGWAARSYGKIFHVGNVAGEVDEKMMDLGKSWDEAAMFHATPTGRKGQTRNLTGGKLKWCVVGQMEGTDDDQPDGQTAAQIVKSIEELTAAGKPWFLGAGFHRPHDPFLVPRRYFDLYPLDSLKLHHDPAGMTPAPPLAVPGGETAAAFAAFTDADRLDFQRAYYAGVSFTDAQVGRLLDTLERLKLWDRTIVIFIGDNGYHHNERNWWNKDTLFERSCRIPMVIAAPGGKAGRSCGSLVELVDLYPTVADYCGVKAPDGLAGQSLRPQLEDPTHAAKKAAFTLVTRGLKYGQSVRTERYRCTLWSDGAVELYDEQDDPEETRNLATNAAHAATLRELTAALRALPKPRLPAE